MARTKTEAALADLERAHHDDPVRADMLRRARLFKASWIDLAEALVRLEEDGSFRQWGYASLGDYAKAELMVRSETLDKLLGGFRFLKKQAPEVLERDGVVAKIPSYQSVDFLRRAEERDEAPAEVMDDLRRRVLDEAAELPAVTKKFREVAFPQTDDDRAAKDRASLRGAASRLDALLSETQVVEGALLKQLRDPLQRLLATLSDEG